MAELYSEDEVIAAVAALTHHRLSAFVAAEVVTPMQGEAGHVYRRIDIARLELLCELSDTLELEEDALAVVISLIDQLHATRAELDRLTRAVAAQPEDVQRAVAEAFARLAPADDSV